MANIKFTGIMPALVTPFEKDNKTVNEKVAKDLIDYYLSQGANGFYIVGSTGEGIVMSREERERMCEICVKHTNGRKPVICHVASINNDEMIELAKHAEKTGADAVAAIPPAILSYTSDDIYNYYKKLAQSVNIPVIVYYFPGAQSCMSPELLARIYEIDNVTGVKWSANNYYAMMRLKDMTHGEMNIINGPDEMLLQGLAAGADAGIGATYNVMFSQFVKIYDYFKEKEFDKALETQIKVNRIIDSLIKYQVIPSVKYGTTLLGFDVGDATFPMKSLTDEEKVAFEKEIRAKGWPFEQ